MKATRLPGSFTEFLATTAILAAIVPGAGFAQNTRPEAARNVVLWDTVSPVGEELDADTRAQWKVVPNDLLVLETNRLKSSSDPGYYGREYVFKGDAVVETPTSAAVFRSAKGCMAIYARSAGEGEWANGKVLEVCPVPAGTGPAGSSRVEIVQNASDGVALKVSFASAGSSRSEGVFAFDKTGIVEVKPGENMKNVRVSGPMQYGVVPAFIGDDLIYGGSEQYGSNTLAVPSESLFVGLLPGEGKELVVTWPKGKERLSLRLGGQAGESTIQSLDFENAPPAFYLALLSAPGIWHKETLGADAMEKDVRIEWKRPFPARWKTQLYEEELKTTFVLREFKADIWRGVAGFYVYPAWFSGDEAYFHLSKKIPPRGDSLIYCLEGRETPAGILTPADILKQTLGRQGAEPILDIAGRKLRTHHRRGGDGVRRACTCGCTEAIQSVFEAAQAESRKNDVQAAVEDMIYFVRCHVERINEYRRFADALLKTIEQKRGPAPELKPFLDSIEEIARQIPQECEVQKENMKSLAYADELAKKTLSLTSTNDPANLKPYLELLKAWRDMGGAQDYVVAKCYNVTRSLGQAAGYGCAALPQAVALAERIRAECRQTLRNPDGYEIWADY